jgi:hypothetical protein
MKTWHRYAITALIALAVFYFVVPAINKFRAKSTTTV